MKNILVLLICTSVISSVFAQTDYSNSETTQVVLLGTGTPVADPNRSGCSVAIIVNAMPYIIDFGPGVVRQLAAVTEYFSEPDKGIKGLNLNNLTHAFLTHLHSDHSSGYPDLILTPWGVGGSGRNTPLEVYGPKGLNNMTEHILKAYEEDIKYRINGIQNNNNQGWRVNSHEILEEGIIFQDDNVKVEAFPAPHGTWTNAWSFRFTTPDKVIVISGDTGPSDKLANYARGADILVHGVYSEKLMHWASLDYFSTHHTSTTELANIANLAQPKLLVLYHVMPSNVVVQDYLDEISEIYKGKVIFGNDLDRF
jgi:ribonuclease BN (tRNA processing enzyme)